MASTRTAPGACLTCIDPIFHRAAIPIDDIAVTGADIGAGYCDFINQIHAATKYAVDTNPDVTRLVGPGVQFVPTTAIEAINLPEHSLDVALISNVLEHLTHERCAVLFDRLDNLPAAEGRSF